MNDLPSPSRPALYIDPLNRWRGLKVLNRRLRDRLTNPALSAGFGVTEALTTVQALQDGLLAFELRRAGNERPRRR